MNGLANEVGVVAVVVGLNEIPVVAGCLVGVENNALLLLLSLLLVEPNKLFD